MLDRAAVDELALVFQTLDDLFVRIFDIEPGVIGNLFCKFALFIQRADFGNTVRFSGDGVIFTESRRDVNDSGTVFGADVVGIDHAECAFGFLAGEIGEERFVTHARKVFSLAAFHDGRDVLFVIGAQTRFRKDVECTVVVDLDVVDVGTGCKRHVGGQGPRRGGPCEEIGVLLSVDFETDCDCRIVDFHIALIGFKVGERRGAA